MNKDSYFKSMDRVVRSWTKIKRNPKYADLLGQALYMKLLEIDPDAKELYTFSKNEETVFQEAKNHQMNSALRKQSRSFLMGIDMAVDTFGVDMDIFEEELEKLGAKHIQFGVLPKDYPLMGQAFVFALKEKCPSIMNSKTVEAWKLLYQFMSTAMMRGAMRCCSEKQSSSQNQVVS